MNVNKQDLKKDKGCSSRQDRAASSFPGKATEGSVEKIQGCKTGLGPGGTCEYGLSKLYFKDDAKVSVGICFP